MPYEVNVRRGAMCLRKENAREEKLRRARIRSLIVRPFCRSYEPLSIYTDYPLSELKVIS